MCLRNIISWSFIITLLTDVSEPKLEPFIVGGEDVHSIKNYPHSAHLDISCYSKSTSTYEGYYCGASILNQAILLTAAHCYYMCSNNGTTTVISVGSKNRFKYPIYNSSKFKVHDDFSFERVKNDIALVKVSQNIKFTPKVGRVVLADDLEQYEAQPAELAGWGCYDEVNGYYPVHLKVVQQKLLNRQKCLKAIHYIPHGTFCGLPGNNSNNGIKSGFASEGDSGSALVVNHSIQVGLVSYKKPAVANDVIVYTDIAHHLHWIQLNSKNLYCNNNL